ncbi:tetratricopeptide repeat protein [Thiomicrospira cyclica]|uniref:Sel1 domain protein repeat-containing protein n=1 Tax=Thiomicrospira cyclica (strain DSM 14477 / JCM 11371 / ALM1) TaxID=717773 RepID=F6DBV3_THICA|nr:tetratricopeptide repeat protein [Thiomicrospira cyclica]AEG31339.1 Sel1 domain protein repeat-containing protein [Thiomicrospira cyclica ALM1]
MMMRFAMTFVMLLLMLASTVAVLPLVYASQDTQINQTNPSATLLPDNFYAASQAYATEDYATAYRLFLPMAEQGNVFAQFALGKIYRFGEGREVDYAKALVWYQHAARQRYGVAQSHLGEMYEQGLGTPVALDTAKYWYQTACHNLCSEGCGHLNRLAMD